MRINPSIKALSLDDPEKNLANTGEVRVPFNAVKKLFNEVNDAQLRSDKSQQAFATGETDSIHQVIMDMEDALMSMKLATQIRNKAVEAYQDIIRMQI